MNKVKELLTGGALGIIAGLLSISFSFIIFRVVGLPLKTSWDIYYFVKLPIYLVVAFGFYIFLSRLVEDFYNEQ